MDIDCYNILNLESTYYLQHYYKQALKHGLFTWNWYTCPHSAKIFIDRQFDGYLLWYLRYLCRWWFCRQVTQCQVERTCDLHQCQNWRTLLPIRFDWVSTVPYPGKLWEPVQRGLAGCAPLQDHPPVPLVQGREGHREGLACGKLSFRGCFHII